MKDCDESGDGRTSIGAQFATPKAVFNAEKSLLKENLEVSCTAEH
jgi:hypothetical protein